MASCTSLYEILRIPAAASNQEIKAAYRRLARVCHPDAAAVGRKNSSADEFMKIHAAYSTLSDPEKRASYDKSLFRHQQPLTTTTASRFSGYSGRNWETDQCW
ncbi:chaperone protein dnaJ 11, chloroplastic-like [Gastrolobium bilobum]|uniref:chaperone protein dnaJ 11, chloroplastic-like n=1 Tax=Gastrolobium bilobum TaxID=150636 RepID=UPI002AB1C344|nr:chaperone protein dnaJ 11, chloroplastic-like [Gastrolobium bilobum]